MGRAVDRFGFVRWWLENDVEPRYYSNDTAVAMSPSRGRGLQNPKPKALPEVFTKDHEPSFSSTRPFLEPFALLFHANFCLVAAEETTPRIRPRPYTVRPRHWKHRAICWAPSRNTTGWWDFPQTLTFATARDELLKQGYSLGAGMESWTSQLIVDMENELVSKGKEFDPQDGLVVRLPKTDAWGQYLWVEYSAGPKFVFRVMSAGPDGLPDTDDDLGIYHKPPPQVGTEQAPKPAGGPLDGRSVGDGEDSPDDPSAETAEPAPQRAISAMEAQELKKYKSPDTAVRAGTTKTGTRPGGNNQQADCNQTQDQPGTGPWTWKIYSKIVRDQRLGPCTIFPVLI